MDPIWPERDHHRLRSDLRNHLPPPPWLSQLPLYKLGAAARSANAALGAALEPTGLSINEFAALAVVATIGPISQRGIGMRLRLDRTSTSELIKRLETRDCILRERDERDRRAWLISTTETGDRLLESAADPIALAERSFFGRLNRIEIDRLCALVESLSSLRLLKEEFQFSRGGQRVF